MANQLTMFNSKNNNFLIEDTTITNATMEKGELIITHDSGAIERKKTGQVEKRITNKIIMHFQQNNHSYDRIDAERRATEIIKEDLKSKNITQLSEKIFEVAVSSKVREIMKEEIKNEFKCPKNKFRQMAETSANNDQHLNSVLDNLQSKDAYKITELTVDENYNLIKRNLSVQFLPTGGEEIKLSNTTDEEDNIILKINEDLIPYVVVPNKNSYTSGYIILNNWEMLIDMFDFTYTDIIYKLCIQIEKIWQNKKYTFPEVQSMCGTKYGVKKKLNPDFNPKNKDSKPHERFLKNKLGDYLYEMKGDSYVYEEDFHTSYRFFKRDVLEPAIEEINKKTPYHIILIEHRRGNKVRTPIEYIQFQVTRKKNSKMLDDIKYSSMGYYAATRLFWHKYDNKEELVGNMDSFAEKLQDEFLKGNFKQNILEISSLNELNETTQNNREAINQIKTIFAANIDELAHYSFSEKYLVIFDTSTPKRRAFYSRLGDDAISCLERLVELHPAQIKQALTSKEETSNTNMLDFTPFEFYDAISERWITISKFNFEQYETNLNTEISKGNKKAFKGFKNRGIKKEFFQRFVD